VSSETFVSAMLLITGVVAAAILIVAVLPVIWGMVGTFSSASATTDRSMRTDFKIVTTYSDYSATPAPAGATLQVWMKNTGTARFALSEISSADVFFGKSDSFGRANYTSVPPLRSAAHLKWWYIFNPPPGGTDLNQNGIWDPGETLEIDSFSQSVGKVGDPVYFQFTLPNSVTRSLEFTAA